MNCNKSNILSFFPKPHTFAITLTTLKSSLIKVLRRCKTITADFHHCRLLDNVFEVINFIESHSLRFPMPNQSLRLMQIERNSC